MSETRNPLDGVTAAELGVNAEPLRAPPQCEGSCHDETDCSHVAICRAVFEAYHEAQMVEAADDQQR